MLKKEKQAEERRIMRLIPHRRRGLFGRNFSRMAGVLLLMCAELSILYSVYHWFSGYFAMFTVLQGIFSLAMLLYLFNCGMDGTAKLTWLYLIMLFPVPATIVLWVSRRGIGQRMVRWRILQLIQESGESLKQEAQIPAAAKLQESGTDDLCRYLNRSGTFPIYQDTETTYYPCGEEAFEAMLEELKKAREFIYLEYFIIDEGYMWGSILKILADKARAGVDVRVMYDGMCEVALLPSDYPRRMEAQGIKCKPFTPISPFLSTLYNYRDHRKIMVIDGKAAFTGGINLADEYINRKEVYGHWKDAAIRLKGKAVSSFTLMFLQMWNITERTPEWDKIVPISVETDQKWDCAPSLLSQSAGFVLPYGDCPLDDDKVGEKVYMDILYRARDYVHIMTPYLILDDALENALEYAAERGVDVRIILPGIPDKTIPYALAKTHYKALLKSGVKIYTYTPGFLHSKVFVSDDEKAVVGTINLDYRSLYHHFECAAYLYRTPCVADIEADFQSTILDSQPVSTESIRGEKLRYRILGVLFKALAPFM